MSELQKALAEIKEMERDMIELIVVIGKHNAQLYHEYVANGLDPRTAVELTKATGLSLRGGTDNETR